MSEINTLIKELELSYKAYNEGNIKDALNYISALTTIAQKNSEKSLLCVCLALKALYSYSSEPFIKVMSGLENANFLASSTGNTQAKDIINYVFSYIYYKEKDIILARRYFELIKDFNNLPFNTENLRCELLKNSNEEQDKSPMIALLNIAKTISSKTNIDSLLKTIADETTNALNAERCSVFILDKDKNELWSKVATGINTEEIRFPINKGLAGHVALTGETVNIKDAYSDTRFNKEIDIKTGYHTKNILCMPIRNLHYEIIGVIQVLNKRNTSFSQNDEKLLVTIGMNAGIAIENTRLFRKQQQMLEQQHKLFSSFVDTLVASIDARDKITSGHSTRVTMYSKLICEEMKLSEVETSLIEEAAILHDIGKIGIRDSVLQKEGLLTPEEYAQEERQRIDQLILTPSDVERALYYGLEMDFEDLKALIAVRAPQVDIKAIGIEFRAKDFYRGALDKEGNRLVDMIGLLLGLTTEELDYLFEHKELPQEAIDRVKPIIHSILHPVEPTEPEEDPTEPEEDPTEPEE